MKREVWNENQTVKPEPSRKVRDEQVRALRHAIEHEEVRPYYQPIVDLRSRRILGFELLARWVSPVHGMVEPDAFIPFATAAGLLNELTRRLLTMACSDAAQWPSDLTLAINVSPSQLIDDALATVIEKCARANNFSLSRLVVEITEDVFHLSPERAATSTNQLRALGVRLAMDDFGIGESNIRRLGLVEFDIIKIDQCVIRNMTRDKRTHRGLIAAIAAADALGLEVIAEGVEEDWQAEIVRSLGCSCMQGWLTGRPMPAGDVPSCLRCIDPSGEALYDPASVFLPAPKQVRSQRSVVHAALAGRSR
jgi:EAL domain-containing protein (putative c-di-GMP-specific phosphodiesterase class I)